MGNWKDRGEPDEVKAPGKWFHSLAVSALHKCLRLGDIETSAHATAWLMRYPSGQSAAWRRLLAFCAEDLGGEGCERVAALHYNWVQGHEDDNIYAAIIHLCRLVKGVPTVREPGQLNREADELKCAAIYWVQIDKPATPPQEANDMHLGNGTLMDWWNVVNKLGPASPWRDDAMKMRLEKKTKVPENQGKLL